MYKYGVWISIRITDDYDYTNSKLLLIVVSEYLIADPSAFYFHRIWIRACMVSVYLWLRVWVGKVTCFLKSSIAKWTTKIWEIHGFSMSEKKDFSHWRYEMSVFFLWWGLFNLHKNSPHQQCICVRLCAWWMGGKVKTEGLHYISHVYNSVNAT